MLAKPRTWFIAVAIWAVVLFLLSSQSHLTPPGPDFDNKDKVMHAGYFALGGFCLFMMLRLRSPAMSTLKLCLLVILFCSLVGVTDEFHQSFVANRSGNDPGDWLADTVGGMIACAVGILLSSILRPKSSTP